MRVSYHQDTDSMYIEITDSPVDESEEVAPNTVLHFDEHGEVCALEILAGASGEEVGRAVLKRGFAVSLPFYCRWLEGVESLNWAISAGYGSPAESGVIYRKDAPLCKDISCPVCKIGRGERETVMILSDDSAVKALRDLKESITNERYTLPEVEGMISDE